MEMGQPVPEHKAIDVLRARHVLQCPGQAIHQETQGGSFRVRQIAQSGGVPLGLGDEITPICHRRSAQRIGVTGIDQFILEEDASRRAISQRMFGADKAVHGWWVFVHTQSIPRQLVALPDPESRPRSWPAGDDMSHPPAFEQPKALHSHAGDRAVDLAALQRRRCGPIAVGLLLTGFLHASHAGLELFLALPDHDGDAAPGLAIDQPAAADLAPAVGTGSSSQYPTLVRAGKGDGSRIW